MAVPRQSLGPSRGGQPRTLDENHASTHILPREKVLDLGSLEMQNGLGSFLLGLSFGEVGRGFEFLSLLAS